VSRSEIDDFRERHSFWIEDWARSAGGGAIADQVRFEREWGSLRRYAEERGVKILGDIAIYVAPDSVDHRSHRELFQEGAVAGAPPDAFTDDGQLWGNPLYDWPAMQRRGYRWWVERLRRTMDLFDVARIDHFRGFVAYWSVPADAPTAKSGHWQRGPGRAVFDAMERSLGTLPLVAEDLGVITPGVRRLREQLGLPGMVVLQFGFNPRQPKGANRLVNHTEDRIVYTGTHDNDTARGWYESLPRRPLEMVEAELAARGIEERESWWALIRLAFSSRASVAIVQAQDVLGLGSEARMNDPGRRSGNWRWQLEPRALKPALARRLRAATEEAGRLAGS
jgi:4-alpha-glucanotransferase